MMMIMIMKMIMIMIIIQFTLIAPKHHFTNISMLKSELTV